ncbi:hypothetical protein MKX03_025132 [Papaver bracteatum]|nr:hypothetical protein MKX03_025132 [Papaver bracteatum]
MIPLLVIHFFIFLFLINTILAKHQQKCETFECSILPLNSSNTIQPECGVLPINFTAGKPTHVDPYQVKYFWKNKTFVIHDHFLQQQLNPTICNPTFLPKALISSFQLIVSSFTNCRKNPTLDKGIVPDNVQIYKDCGDVSGLYYNNPEQLNLSQFLENQSITYCKMVDDWPSAAKDNNPVSPFIADFYWKWEFSPQCQCYNGEGHCPTSFDCVQAPKSNRTRKIKIGVGAAVAASLLTFLVAFLLFRRWRKNDLHNSSTLISRSISPDLSMKPDPEKGSSYFNTPIFSYKELEEATNNFDSSKELGDGGFGTVYYGKLKDGRAVAVKRLYENNCKRVEQFMNEVSILSLLRHQNRDVKTNNILLDKNFHVKVADFGLSRLFPNDVTHVSTAPQGTPGYVDPDYYQCYQLTDKSDVYSFGLLTSLVTPQQRTSSLDINRHRDEINLSTMALNKIHCDALHELVDMSLGFDTNASVRKTMTLVAELAYRCLQQDTDARPSMADVLEVLKEIEVEGSKVVKPGELTNGPA